MRALIPFFIVFNLFSTARAQSPGDGRIGAGIVIGAPTALTGKYWTTSDEAIDFGLSFWGYRWTMLYGDYHWNWAGAFGHRSRFVSQLTPYVGIGAGLVFWGERRDCGRWACDAYKDSGTAIFARVPLGIEWYPANPPLLRLECLSNSFPLSQCCQERQASSILESGFDIIFSALSLPSTIGPNVQLQRLSLLRIRVGWCRLPLSDSV
jgi:hypothetical protein